MPFRNSKQVVNRLIDAYGEEFMQYILNIQSGNDDLLEMASGITVPSPQEESVMRTLQRIWKKCAIWNGTWNQQHELSTELTSSKRQNGSTLVNRLRKSCGGNVEEEYNDEPDVLLRQYLRFIAAAYPVIIMYLEKTASSELDRSGLIGNLNKNHPARIDFRNALKHDDLNELFPSGEEQTWIWSTGNTSTYNPEKMVDQLIYALVDRPEVQSGITLWSLEALAREVLADARQIARRKEVDVPIVAGLSGVRILSEKSFILIEDSASGQPHAWLTTTLASRMPDPTYFSPIESGMTCELVWYDKMRLLGNNSADSKLLMKNNEIEIEQGRRRRQQYLDHARLGIVATQADFSKIPALLIAERILSPLGRNGFTTDHESERVDVFMEPPGRPPGVGYSGWVVLHNDDMGIVKESCTKLLNATDNKSLALAARRLCLSLGIRNDPEDRIIDAVVSGEALVGGSEPKTTGRRNSPKINNGVSYTLAKTLADLLYPSNVGAQKQALLELQEVIRMRGRIVHGGGRNVEEIEGVELTLKRISDAEAKMSTYVRNAFFIIAQDDELSKSKSSVERRKIIIDRQQK